MQIGIGAMDRGLHVIILVLYSDYWNPTRTLISRNARLYAKLECHGREMLGFCLQCAITRSSWHISGEHDPR